MKTFVRVFVVLGLLEIGTGIAYLGMDRLPSRTISGLAISILVWVAIVVWGAWLIGRDGDA